MLRVRSRFYLLYFLNQSGCIVSSFSIMEEQSIVKSLKVLKSKEGKGWTTHLQAHSLSIDFEREATTANSGCKFWLCSFQEQILDAGRRVTKALV